MKINESWEELENTQSTMRLKVIGGWVVKSIHIVGGQDSCGVGMVFVPDPNHEWVIK